MQRLPRVAKFGGGQSGYPGHQKAGLGDQCVRGPVEASASIAKCSRCSTGIAWAVTTRAAGQGMADLRGDQGKMVAYKNGEPVAQFITRR
jgi:hypothetical protein